MQKIYYKPHKSRQKEKQFFHFLEKRFLEAIHVPEDYAIDRSLLTRSLEKRWVLDRIEKYPLLSFKKKDNCLSALKLLDNEIIVGLGDTRISCDIVIEEGGTPYFFEFHEKQHRIDSNKREKCVYDVNGLSYVVPRYMQRLLRDIWRCKNLDPYTIVWWDWFDKNKALYKPELHAGFREYACHDKFSFQSLLGDA